MQISAIVPAYNCEPYLHRAVASLLAANYPNLEIVIVDDGSRDGTWELATHLRVAHPAEVLALHHPGHVNRGVSATRNLGIERSSGELLCFLDPDDTVLPNRFSVSAAILSSDTTVDAVYERTRIVYDDPSETGKWEGAETFGIAQPVPRMELFQTVLHGIPWHTSGVLVRRGLLARTGLFHERLSIAEDCHLWMRMLAVGNVAAGEFSAPVSEYHRHDSSLYRPGLERKLDYLRALLEFECWVRRQGLTGETLPLARAAVRDWVRNSLVACREQGENGLALRIAVKAVCSQPRLALDRRIMAHVAHIALGRRPR